MSSVISRRHFTLGDCGLCPSEPAFLADTHALHFSQIGAGEESGHVGFRERFEFGGVLRGGARCHGGWRGRTDGILPTFVTGREGITLRTDPKADTARTAGTGCTARHRPNRPNARHRCRMPRHHADPALRFPSSVQPICLSPTHREPHPQRHHEPQPCGRPSACLSPTHSVTRSRLQRHPQPQAEPQPQGYTEPQPQTKKPGRLSPTGSLRCDDANC